MVLRARYCPRRLIALLSDSVGGWTARLESFNGPRVVEKCAAEMDWQA